MVYIWAWQAPALAPERLISSCCVVRRKSICFLLRAGRGPDDVLAHHAFRYQPVYFLLGSADLPQDLPCVGTQARWDAARLGPCPVPREGHPDICVIGYRPVGDRPQDADRLRLRIGHDLIYRADRRARHPGLPQLLHPSLRRIGAETGRKILVQGFAVLDPAGVVLEPRVLQQLLCAQRAAQLTPDRVVPCSDENSAVACRIRLIRRQHCCSGPVTPGYLAVTKVAHDLVGNPSYRGLVERGLDELSLAGPFPVAQSAQNPYDTPRAHPHVHDGGPDPDGSPVRLPRDAHQAREGLHERIVAGEISHRTGIPVSGHRTVDQPRVSAPYHVIAEAQFLEAL